MAFHLLVAMLHLLGRCHFCSSLRASLASLQPLCCYGTISSWTLPAFMSACSMLLARRKTGKHLRDKQLLPQNACNIVHVMLFLYGWQLHLPTGLA